MSYQVLAAATNHPDPVNPYYGLFNARSIAALTERGVNIDVVTPRPFAPPIGPYSEFNDIGITSQHDGYEVHHPRFFYGLPKRLFYGISGRSYAKRVPKYVEQTFETPNLVHAYHVYPDGYGMLHYCREHDLPLFVVAHGAALNEFDQFPGNVQSKIRETVEKSDTVLCVSQALANRVQDIGSNVHTTVLPIGADPSEFPTKQEQQLRAEMDIPEGRPVVFFCGQYVERKGVRDIIDVLPKLSDVDAHFLFVGQDGPLREPLMTALTEAGLTERSTIMYNVPDRMIQRCFTVADLLLLPSYNEGRPTVIYEAMASETAVLATGVGGIPEQVDQGKTGILIGEGNPDALKRELLDLVSDPTTLKSMGENGYQRLIEQGWTWEDHAKNLMEIHTSEQAFS